MASIERVQILLALFCTATILVCQSSQPEINYQTSPIQDKHYFFYQQTEHPRDCQEVRKQCAFTNSSGVYVIKPDGFPEPFEVFCENEMDSGGWTVIQRRENVPISFNRSWSEYKNGFGFLSTDFWLGNEKLSHLTNQAVYELRTDLELSTGELFYTTYKGFRITDEFGGYTLTSIGAFESKDGYLISGCPTNMEYGNCTCQATCEDPTGETACHGNCSDIEGCVCPEGFFIRRNECVNSSECGCYFEEADVVIPEGETFVNDDCNVKCLCSNNNLNCDVAFSCDSNAECSVTNGVRQCSCREDYEGDGESCEPLYRPTDCKDVYDAGNTDDGIYTITPSDWPYSPFNVYCSMDNGGGWTVIQRRVDGSTDFNRNWISYSDGFGDINTNFWLGNAKLYHLTNQREYKLRFEVTTSSGSLKYGEYSEFQIESERTNFRMNKLGSHSGTIGSNLHYSRGKQFSTYDSDNDMCQYANCAHEHRSGWWHFGTTPSCVSCDIRSNACDRFPYGEGCYTVCTYDNLNGVYGGGYGENIFSNYYTNCNLRYVEMKIRPS